MKWWLIEESDVQEIRRGLVAALDYSEECVNGFDAGWYRNLIHRLDSGLHVTEAVPADFACQSAEKAQEEGSALRPQDKGRLEREARETREKIENLKRLEIKGRDLPPAAFRHGG